MASLLAQRFQNRINILRSASNWFASRSGTVWAKKHQTSDLMLSYAASLDELSKILPQPSDIEELVKFLRDPDVALPLHEDLPLEYSHKLTDLLTKISYGLRPVSLDDVFDHEPTPTPAATGVSALPFFLHRPTQESAWLYECKGSGTQRLATPPEISMWQLLNPVFDKETQHV